MKPETFAKQTGKREYETLALELIDEPKTPARHKIHQQPLDDLKDSIAAVGLLQPITVKKTGKRYEIVYGHRRFICHVLLKKPTIDAFVANWSPEKVDVARFLENLDHEALTPLEQCDQLSTLKKKHNYDQQRLAVVTGKSTAWISQRLQINKYPKALKEALANGDLSFSVARLFNQIDDLDYLQMMIGHAKMNGVTPHVANNWVQDYMLRKNSTGDSGTEPSTSHIPETFEHPGQECYLCEERKGFSDLRSHWFCVGCLAVLKHALESDKAQAVEDS